jgi:DNA primase
MPITWDELSTINPTDFNLFNAFDRLKVVGDLFEVLQKEDNLGSLEEVVKHIAAKPQTEFSSQDSVFRI